MSTRRRSVRRIVVRVVAILLLGAVVNVAVAWACVLESEYPPGQTGWQDVRSEINWPRPVPRNWPDASGAGASTLAGIEVIAFSAWRERKRPYGMVVWRSGWPLNSLTWFTLSDPNSTRWYKEFYPTGQVWDDGIDISALRRDQYWDEWRRLPVRPIWPGFAINTFFYAAILWLLFVIPFALRRWRRIRRGLCAKCAYPAGASDVCTECGASVNPAA